MAASGRGQAAPSPEGTAVTIAASVPKSLVDGLDRVAESEGWKRSRAVTEAIRGLVKARTPKRRQGESNPVGA